MYEIVKIMFLIFIAFGIGYQLGYKISARDLREQVALDIMRKLERTGILTCKVRGRGLRLILSVRSHDES